MVSIRQRRYMVPITKMKLNISNFVNNFQTLFHGVLHIFISKVVLICI